MYAQYYQQNFTPTLKLNSKARVFVPNQGQQIQKQSKKERLRQEKEENLKKIEEAALNDKQDIPLDEVIFDLDEVAYDIIMMQNCSFNLTFVIFFLFNNESQLNKNHLLRVDTYNYGKSW